MTSKLDFLKSVLLLDTRCYQKNFQSHSEVDEVITGTGEKHLKSEVSLDTAHT